MAYFPPANGDAQPVFALDINNGSQTGDISSAALVQMAGPKLDFFAIIAKNAGAQAQDLTNQLGNVTSGVYTWCCCSNQPGNSAYCYHCYVSS